MAVREVWRCRLAAVGGMWPVYARPRTAAQTRVELAAARAAGAGVPTIDTVVLS